MAEEECDFDGKVWEKLLKEEQRDDDNTQQAANRLIARAQQEVLSGYYNKLKRGEESPDKKGTLAAYNLFFDEKSGLIRCGARLEKARLSFGRRHPAILPEHEICDALLRHVHAKDARHQGRIITTGTLRDQGYVLLKSSKRIRRVLNSCQPCRRARAPLLAQKMANLPKDRMERTPPFKYVGIDVFGPFFINNGRVTRGNPGKRKIWVLLVTCLYSRAVHLEMLDAMDVPAFQMAFSRFESLRGRCSRIRSDRGTNFMGARNQEDLDEMDEVIDQARNSLIEKGKTWEVNPPHASHFGGVWERAIGSVRRVFEATLMQLEPRLLTRDEFETLIREAAAVVNSTPLWEPSEDANEPQPICPSMLLHQRDDISTEDGQPASESDLRQYGALRHKRIQYLADQFWKEWRQHYLMNLHDKRSKWRKACDNVNIGDVVLVKDKNLHRHQWGTAVVVDVKISADGLVRSVTVEPTTKKGHRLKRSAPRQRPVHDLVLLYPAPKTDTEPNARQEIRSSPSQEGDGSNQN